MGKAYADAEIDRLHALFTAFTAGLLQVVRVDLPFTAYGKAMGARRELLTILLK